MQGIYNLSKGIKEQVREGDIILILLTGKVVEEGGRVGYTREFADAGVGKSI